VGDFSKELCGGTHVNRTGDIGLFKIIEESSLASGVRRIVAVTGPKAVAFMQNQAETIHAVQSTMNCGLDDVAERVDQLLLQKKALEKELKRQKKSGGTFNAKSLVEKAKVVGDYKIVIENASRQQDKYTSMLKPDRKAIERKYKNLIDSMYIM